MRTTWSNLLSLLAVIAALGLVTYRNIEGDRSRELLNVSYDPTRELYSDLNTQFIAVQENQAGRKLTIKQSHGGSSRQAREVANGLEADVVTLALPSDVNSLSKRGLISTDWARRLPNGSVPYTSTIVFVVRKGNPRQVRDWPDVVQPGVSVVTPNPRTSGNGKLSFLAAWGSIISRGGSEAQAHDFVRQLYEHVPLLADGAREAADSFSRDEVGDIHLTWENEALREAGESSGALEVVRPPVSIRAEPSVAWVDVNVTRHGTEAYARSYLEFLFTDGGQETIAHHGYRPINPAVLKRHSDQFPPMELFPITLLAAGWDEAQQKFFADNGVFDLLRVKATAVNEKGASR